MDKRNGYDFFLEIHDGNKTLSDQVKVEDDMLALAIEDTVFSALCEGRLFAGASIQTATIDPVWKDQSESPYVVGVNITICWDGSNDHGEGMYRKQYDKSPFHLRARQLMAELIKKDLENPVTSHEQAMEADEEKTFLWKVAAFPKPADPPDSEPKRFSARVLDSPLVIPKKAPSEFNLAFPEKTGSESLAVFVPTEVIREIQELTIKTEGRLEQAGVLIGHLAQDPSTGRVFSVVTAHLEATVNVEAETHSFKFTAETFMEIRRLIQLRQNNEILLGWQHNHHFCPGCPSNPTGSTIFFSTADIQVQSSAFRPPYMVALVAGRDLDLEPARPAVRMFGWHNADLKPRDFTRYEIGAAVSASK
jgi:hypothetical protein